MNTNATQPTEIDKRLEELVAIKGGREYVMTRVLIAALLRARVALEVADNRMALYFDSTLSEKTRQLALGTARDYLREAREDPELEELLR